MLRFQYIYSRLMYLKVQGGGNVKKIDLGLWYLKEIFHVSEFRGIKI